MFVHFKDDDESDEIHQTWQCQKCMYDNSIHIPLCEMCDALPPMVSAFYFILFLNLMKCFFSFSDFDHSNDNDPGKNKSSSYLKILNYFSWILFFVLLF